MISTAKHFLYNHAYYRNPQGENMFIQTVIKYITNKNKNIIIIDGGFNNGVWSNNILKYATPEHIIAYELSNQTYNKNKLNINTKKINLKHCGLYNENKVIKLKNTYCNDQGYNIDNNIDNNGFDVKLVILDDELINYYDKKFIVKIDIEGAEFKAITGMQKILNNKQLLILQWEIHNEHKKIIPSLKTFVDYLSSFGYFIFILGHENLLRIDSQYYNKYYDITDENLDIDIVRGYNFQDNLKIKIGRPECINCIAITQEVYNNIKNNNIIKIIELE